MCDSRSKYTSQIRSPHGVNYRVLSERVQQKFLHLGSYELGRIVRTIEEIAILNYARIIVLARVSLRELRKSNIGEKVVHFFRIDRRINSPGVH